MCPALAAALCRTRSFLITQLAAPLSQPHSSHWQDHPSPTSLFRGGRPGLLHSCRGLAVSALSYPGDFRLFLDDGSQPERSLSDLVSCNELVFLSTSAPLPPGQSHARQVLTLVRLWPEPLHHDPCCASSAWTWKAPGWCNSRPRPELAHSLSSVSSTPLVETTHPTSQAPTSH